ncbi:hypothetical protein QR680_001751 [Steinernema hermaphroditum]|uniref:Carboxylic ester hydrolase n=1 Tax=Steinernema hermaphroditum TaxID=289476 RepID=A0AA39GZP0_9BILA|nr:hypothetical protein QR680_001751 [Steinernema hermaphroditum]
MLHDFVELSAGCVQGLRYFSKKDLCNYRMYLGVPYAETTAGANRFMKPIPKQHFEGLINATRFGNRCPQWSDPSDNDRGVSESEDCLNLNVFAPASAEKLPVIMYVHGGSFLNGSNVAFGSTNICDALCSKNSVVVVPNYRLGFLGFLWLDSELTAGNLGLWDLHCALLWVHREIEKFGGDPANITLVGQSAGGALVDLMTVSPYTKGLFNKVISISGNRFCKWAVLSRKDVRKHTLQLALRNGWKNQSNNVHNYEKLLEYLREMSEGCFLIDADAKIANGDFEPWIGPIVDGDFIPSVETLKTVNKNISVITGNIECEGILFCHQTRLPLNSIIFEAIVDAIVTDYDIQDRERIVQMYTLSSDDDARKSVLEIVGDTVINQSITDLIDLHRAHNKDLYVYTFRHLNAASLAYCEEYWKAEVNTHGGELPYLFGDVVSKHSWKFDEDDEEMSERFTTMITNFAKSGNPSIPSTFANVHWKPTTVSAVTCLHLSRCPSVQSEFNKGKCFRKIGNRAKSRQQFE